MQEPDHHDATSPVKAASLASPGTSFASNTPCLPKESFHAAEKTIEHYRPPQTLKAAYRELGQDNFVILSPTNLQEFKIA
jgi:hypothetical protein